MTEELMKKYMLTGGKLFTITLIGTYRDGGTKMIECTGDSNYYVDKYDNTLHDGYPTGEDNLIPDGLFKTYLLERLNTYVTRLGEDYERKQNLLKKIR